MSFAVAVLVVWGVLPFGAVHEWALWPLMAGACLLGATGLVAGTRTSSRALFLAVTPALLALAFQLVPLPVESMEPVASGTARFLAAYDASVAAGVRQAHPLSIAPHLTSRAVVMFAALTTLVAGLAALLTRRPALVRSLAFAITLIAVAVALFALAQKATFNGKIYWFWESQFRASSNYYGPFVNRNHFAGWMLLAMALTCAFFVAQLKASGTRVKPGWRSRFLWLGSDEAGRLVLTGAAGMVILISILWSMSRSGIAGTALALGILSATAMYRLRNARKLIAVGTLTGIALLAVGWRGVDTLAAWYGRTQTFDWRVDLWKDTLPALRDFWVFGSGLNTYGTVMLLYSQTDTTVHAVQAHNDYIQLAVEGGLLVGIPVLLLIGLFGRQVWRRLAEPQDEMTWWIRMGAVAGICGIALQEFSEFSLQIPGVAVLFAILVGIAIHKSPRMSLDSPRITRERDHHEHVDRKD